MQRPLLGASLLLILAVAQLPILVSAQVANEGLANGIIAARKKDAALLRQYTWNARTEFVQDGKIQDIRIDAVTCDANGQITRTLLNDQPGQLPGGFIRKAIAENKRKELEKYIQNLSQLLDQYTLPSAGKIIDFLAQAKIQPITAPDGKTTILQITGNNVLVPGDTFSMNVDGKTLHPMSLQITTTNNGDQVAVTASFKTMKTGLNHLQFATVQIAAKDVTINIHNFDYVPND